MSKSREILGLVVEGWSPESISDRFGVKTGLVKKYALDHARIVLRKGFWKSYPCCFEDVVFMKNTISERL